LTTTTANNYWINWVILSVSDFVMFVLVAISAFQSYKSGHRSKFAAIVYRDGLLSYIILLGITAASLVIGLVLPADSRTIIAPQLFSLYAMLTTRIVLNIRETSNLGLQTELHTAYEESLVFAMPLQAARTADYSSNTALNASNFTHS